jgi:hypothetical protein
VSTRAGATTRRAVFGVAVGGYVLVQWLGRTYGATRAECRAVMPGDELVRSPQTTATHAVTVPGPPADVWPWLVQVGWHRGGWYTNRWVDVLFFPDNLPSADHVIDDFQHLAVGDLVPDGRPDTQCGFVVRRLERDRLLVLQSTTHLPLSWRLRGRARISWTWSFALAPVEEGRATRLVFRWRARTRPWWLTAAAQLLVVPADFVMSRGMLRGFRARVVRTAAGCGTSRADGPSDSRATTRS